MRKYRSLWPLPGNPGVWSAVLETVLGMVAESEPVTLRGLVARLQADPDLLQLTQHNRPYSYAFMEGVVDRLLAFVGLIERKGELRTLSDDGRAWLHNRDPRVIGRLLHERIELIEECLAVLDTSLATDVETVHQNLWKLYGDGWNNDDQVRYRLEWLALAGETRRTEDGGWVRTAPPIWSAESEQPQEDRAHQAIQRGTWQPGKPGAGSLLAPVLTAVQQLVELEPASLVPDEALATLMHKVEERLAFLEMASQYGAQTQEEVGAAKRLLEALKAYRQTCRRVS